MTLFVIMDPPGIVPIYLALTGAMDQRERNRAALQATCLSLGVITLFALLGQQIINYLGIDLAALQGAGDCCCSWSASNCSPGRPTTRRTRPPPTSRWCRWAPRCWPAPGRSWR
ncbi:hypothetical protein GCM10029992_02930 [Glycomyces albus]